MYTTHAARTALFAAAILVGCAVTAKNADAQNSATANVTAEVQQPITVSKLTDLEFGNVFPGVNKTVALADATAASFEVNGQGSTQVNLTFTLPMELTRTAGTETMPITTWTGITNTTASPTGAGTFTPSASAHTATLHTTGELFVYVGATAEPDVAQVAGSYTGTLTVTVVYF